MLLYVWYSLRSILSVADLKFVLNQWNVIWNRGITDYHYLCCLRKGFMGSVVLMEFIHICLLALLEVVCVGSPYYELVWNWFQLLMAHVYCWMCSWRSSWLSGVELLIHYSKLSFHVSYFVPLKFSIARLPYSVFN